jgi:hypothetical protein
MTRTKRPWPVTILGCVYIVIGVVGFGYHFTELQANGAFQYDVLWIELVRVIAVVCGVFLLRGQNWARWMTVAWIALHVILSAFHTLPEFSIHVLFCAVVAWLLFRSGGARYFRGPQSGVTE